MESPFQPLPDKFIPQTLIAFLRFCALHPLICVLSCLLTLAPIVIAPTLPTFFTMLYNGVLSVPSHMFLTAIIGTSTWNYLASNQTKIQDSPSNLYASFSMLTSFIREHYSHPNSPFKWASVVPKLLMFCLPFYALISVISPSAEPQPPATTLNDILTENLLFIPLLGLGGAALFTSAQITAASLFKWKKTGGFILAAMLFPVLKDPTISQKTQEEILRLNSAKQLALLFSLWAIIRIPLSLIGASTLVDAFAFSALVHASLGGTLSPSKATETQHTPPNVQPQPAL